MKNKDKFMDFEKRVCQTHFENTLRFASYLGKKIKR